MVPIPGGCLVIAEGKRVGTGRIAGTPVVRYRRVDEDGEVTELALAPALGCELMEEEHTWKGTWGIPGAKWHYVVTSYTAGEPDFQVFQIPLGYSLQLERR